MSEETIDGFGFKKLRVWQQAAEFAGVVYSATKSFPREELFGLAMQLRRASVSVAANIAEGTSRASGKDQARFFEIAYGSLSEVVTMLHIASQQAFLSERELADISAQASDMCRMLSGLRRSALGHGK